MVEWTGRQSEVIYVDWATMRRDHVNDRHVVLESGRVDWASKRCDICGLGDNEKKSCERLSCRARKW